MSIDTSNYRIEAARGTETMRKRLVILPQMDGFWQAPALADLRNVCWTPEGIEQVMRWCNLGQDDDLPVLAIAEPEFSPIGYRTRGFRMAWESWCSRYSRHRPKCEVFFSHYTGNDPGDPCMTDSFGYHDGVAISVACFPRDFIGWSSRHVWGESLKATAARLTYALDGDADLAPVLAQGVPCLDAVEEVVILRGTTDHLEAQAFHVAALEAYRPSA